MKLIYNKVFLEHDTGEHPENSRRITKVAEFGRIKETKIINGEKYLDLVHDKNYIDYVKQACEQEIHLDPDTFASKGSYKSAINAVGAAIMASESKDFALVRPPGHHAHPSKSGGFCIFNNIAVSVKRLVEQDKKVLIIDFDGHLGDGTMKVFYDTDEVLYFSTHQYPAFPGKGWVNETGKGKGKGYTINVPLPPGTADDLYIDVIKRFLPTLIEFNPEVVAISAGFDAYQKDPLLNLKLSINTYYKLGKFLSKSFKNIYAVYEGGYNIDALPHCVFNFLDGINGKEQRFTEELTYSTRDVKKVYNKRINLLENNLKKYWD